MNIFFIHSLTLAIGLSFMGASSQTLAETPIDSSEPLTLRGIMQQLDKEMQNVTAAISSEDWAKVERSAAWIADHPRPSMAERKRIMGFLGSDAGKFKGSDKKTHEAALALRKAAASKNGHSVIVEFATLQKTCLSCHQNFRPVIQKHFYDQR